MAIPVLGGTSLAYLTAGAIGLGASLLGYRTCKRAANTQRKNDAQPEQQLLGADRKERDVLFDGDEKISTHQDESTDEFTVPQTDKCDDTLRVHLKLTGEQLTKLVSARLDEDTVFTFVRKSTTEENTERVTNMLFSLHEFKPIKPHTAVDATENPPTSNQPEGFFPRRKLVFARDPKTKPKVTNNEESDTTSEVASTIKHNSSTLSPSSTVPETEMSEAVTKNKKVRFADNVTHDDSTSTTTQQALLNAIDATYANEEDISENDAKSKEKSATANDNDVLVNTSHTRNCEQSLEIGDSQTEGANNTLATDTTNSTASQQDCRTTEATDSSNEVVHHTTSVLQTSDCSTDASPDLISPGTSPKTTDIEEPVPSSQLNAEEDASVDTQCTAGDKDSEHPEVSDCSGKYSKNSQDTSRDMNAGASTHSPQKGPTNLTRKRKTHSDTMTRDPNYEPAFPKRKCRNHFVMCVTCGDKLLVTDNLQQMTTVTARSPLPGKSSCHLQNEDYDTDSS